ncbi:WYL domain-containing protein [Tsukamurella sp. 8F]|uniref:helix-turn-helix transcriptional regulator n=1 Tax=unclassified Tsukamurella TaxID=2633480 RepID=UPI0023B9D4AA|nr:MULTISPECIES: WYL domain-containing protein [unclassified Tsukamurella]MDF0531994.1 WYL domain-containing protein [Tsukamurella sp. 8J]MDF0588893.1 WYL domain-containing protein [Tsukamurella sp. 8F]
MRADRLLAVLMLLRHRGRVTAAEIAEELEVSVRTVLRDVESLSAAGVPVYTDRGRGGGIRLLPGYRTDLTGLTEDESKALLASGAGRVDSPAFASAMRKVAAALPEPHRAAAAGAAQRILVRPDGFARPRESEPYLGLLQHAVIDGLRVRCSYRSPRSGAAERILDPVGLVHAGDRWYLLARHHGADRTYRVSRFDAVELLDEPADRPVDVDLDAAFDASRTSFRESLATTIVTVTVEDEVRDLLLRNVMETLSSSPAGAGRSTVVVRFGGEGHALRTLWSLTPKVEIHSPAGLRAKVADRAAAASALYS